MEQTHNDEHEESPASKISNSIILSKDILNLLYQYLNSNGEEAATDLVNIYRATRDGDANFHAFCDNKGPTVVVILANGHLFGGYTSIDWDDSGSFKTDTKSFVFSLTNPQKYLVFQGNNYWAIYSATGSTTFHFGNSDIVISNPFLNDSTNTCKV
jgi:hypothetical protein